MGLLASQLGNVVQSSVDASGRSEAGVPLWKRLAYVAITRAEKRLPIAASTLDGSATRVVTCGVSLIAMSPGWFSVFLAGEQVAGSPGRRRRG